MIHPTMDYSNDPGGGSNEEINVGSSLNMVPPPHSMMEYQETLLSDPSPFNSLFPALVDCFGIILLGYLAGRFNFISETEAKGLNTFVGTFALPALIFRNLCRLNFDSVNWAFLGAILLAKASVFFSVMIITFLTAKESRISKAGLYAIFATQSNDFALGYPILLALYEKTAPEIPRYLYLMAPISLAILNPIGFILMEIGKVRSSIEISSNTNDTEERFTSQRSPQPNGYIHRLFNVQNKNCRTCLQIIKGVITNPLIFMTVLGAFCGAFIDGEGKVPDVIDNFLETLGNAFSATALFLLGLKMVGRIKSLKGKLWIAPLILIVVKILILPIFAREFTSGLIGQNDKNSTKAQQLSDFAFLYGTFPAAPTVFVYASKYNIVPDVIASAMVVCTLLSAPMMFVSAQLLTITYISPKDYVIYLDNFLLDISVLALLASIFTGFIFLISKNWRNTPHCHTLALIASQGIACAGAILWSVLNCTHGWKLYLQFSIFTFGVYSSRVYAATLALSLVCAVTYSRAYVEKMKPFFLVSGIIIPLFLVGVQLLTVQHETNPHGDRNDPNFQYGVTSVAVALTVLIITLLVIIVSLVLTHRSIQSSNYIIDRNDRNENEDERRLLQSPTPEEEAESLVNDERQFNSITQAADKLIRVTASAAENSNEKDTEHLKSNTSSTDSDSMVPTEELISIDESNVPRRIVSNGKAKRASKLNTSPKDIEDVVPDCKNTDSCNECPENKENKVVKRRRYRCDSENCRALLSRYDAPPAIDVANEESSSLQYMGYGDILNNWNKPDDPNEVVRHSILLLCLGLSMFVGIALCIWTLLMDQMTGIYVMLIFLDGFLNFGQGIFAFIIFGMQSTYVFLPLKAWCQKLIYGQDSLVLPAWEDVNDETKSVCQQFLKHHISHCMDSILKDVRSRFGSLQKGVFYGSDLVDWLIEVGLTHSRQDAVTYGQHLVTGRVIRHADNYLNFYDDKNFLYTFEQLTSIQR